MGNYNLFALIKVGLAGTVKGDEEKYCSATYCFHSRYVSIIIINLFAFLFLGLSFTANSTLLAGLMRLPSSIRLLPPTTSLYCAWWCWQIGVLPFLLEISDSGWPIMDHDDCSFCLNHNNGTMGRAKLCFRNKLYSYILIRILMNSRANVRPQWQPLYVCTCTWMPSSSSSDGKLSWSAPEITFQFDLPL